MADKGRIIFTMCSFCCRPAYNPYENDLPIDVDDDEQIGIVVLGTNGLAQELENKIKVSFVIDMK